MLQHGAGHRGDPGSIAIAQPGTSGEGHCGRGASDQVLDAVFDSRLISMLTMLAVAALHDYSPPAGISSFERGLNGPRPRQ